MVERSDMVLDATYGALAHPVRRDILVRLRDGDRRVTDLAEPVAMSLAAVSKHIGVLERAGLVRRAVRGREHRLAVSGQPLAEAAAWLEAYRAFWDERLDALASLLQERGEH